MRADRLLSLLMLLQARGRMTAGELATELEVSERTIYRDIDALSAAHVPVYAECGRQGGFELLDSYRTELTGLTQGEVRALFMLSIPEPLSDLGVGHELRAALLKLSAALPDAQRADEERVRRRFHLDSVWWDQVEESVPHLQTVQNAVWRDRRLVLKYRLPLAIEIEQTVDPYGLVAKAGVWYLVYAVSGTYRIHRVSALLDAWTLEEDFERHPDFDLARFWKEWCAAHDESLSAYAVTLRVAPGFLAELPRYFGDRVRDRIALAGPADDEGWITMQLRFESLAAARDRILSFGGGVEVLEPRALRRSVADFAAQIVARYSQ
jgi:predicted DNA-binding transcriptional regulator YafY